MRKRLFIMLAAGLIWFFIVSSICAVSYGLDNKPSEFTYFNSFSVLGDILYITENKQYHGFLYSIKEDKTVDSIFDTRSYENGGIFQAVKGYTSDKYGSVFASIKKEVKYSGKPLWVWQVLTLTPDLKLKYVSDLILPVGGTVLADIDVKDDILYLVFQEKEGTAAYSYQIPLSDFILVGGADLDNEEQVKAGTKIVTLKAFETFIPPAGRFISDVYYEKGDAVLRLDSDDEDDYVRNYELVQKLFSSKILNLRQNLIVHRDILRFGGILLGVGLVIIFLVLFVIGSRSKNVYTLLMVELLVAVLTAAGCMAFINERSNIRNNAAEDFAGYTVQSLYDEIQNVETMDYYQEGFYDTQQYRDVQKRLAQAINRRGGRQVFYDIFIADTDTKKVLVSASGRNNMRVDLGYTSSMNVLFDKLAAGEETAFTNLIIEGVDYRGVGVRGASIFSPKYALMAVVAQTYIGDNYWAFSYSFALFGVASFLVCSIAIVLFMYLQSLDLRRITKAMQEIATGRLFSEKPRYLMGKDLDTLWNAMYQVDKRVQSINYTKFLIFESYYRFAPKSVEKLLGKSSITEVKSGNSSSFNATMAMISTDEANKERYVNVKALEIQLDVISRYQDEEKGILVSGDCSLSLMEMIFPQERTETTAFGIHLMHQLETGLGLEKINTFMMLHYDYFNYGVVGNVSQAAAYTVSDETQELDDYIRWLRECNLRLVVTQAVIDREEIPGKVRTVGYVNLKCSGQQLKLYEVLDAECERIRLLKMESLDRYEESLRLYYAQDFYLAISGFTEVVKKYPEDELAKWYLFRCEDYIENSARTFEGSINSTTN